ncbi:hypothetical protein C8Q78DRAFT_1074210 [Trametes maxima]|nr:hypothetical protein C8Q78DRAFT_1074210 [Trametes maxima]
MSARHAHPSAPAPSPELNSAQLSERDQTPYTMAPWTNGSRSSNNGRDAVRTILVFSAVVGPLAFVPYLFVRRRLSGLHQQVADLHAANVGLRRDLKAAVAEARKAYTESADRSIAVLQETKGEVMELRNGLHAGIGEARRQVVQAAEREGKRIGGLLVHADQAARERDRRREVWESEIKHGIQALLSENLERRMRFAEELKDVGQSLADTAAFIQEVEMRYGWTPRPEDGRGIERTRNLAKRLQEVAASMQEGPGEQEQPESQETEPYEKTKPR